jgi:hypothetical protein
MTNTDLPLFGGKLVSAEVEARRWPKDAPRSSGCIQQLHRRYGYDGAHRCGDCVRFWQKRWGTKSFFKCELYVNSACAASDWRKGWPACGMFLDREGDGAPTR